MPKYVGIKNNQVSIVSDKLFNCSNDTAIIELPVDMEKLTVNDLIVNYRLKNNVFVPKSTNKLAKDLKIAFIGNWKMACGISEYNNFLLQKVLPKVGEFKLFIEENDQPTDSIYTLGQQTLQPEQVSVCWKRGSSLQKLVKEVKEYNPDICWIGHEFGLFPNAMYWLSMMTQLSEYRIIVTMHSIFHHQDKTIIEASIPEIIVHLEGAKKVLKEEKQIAGKVHVLPHGCNTNNGKRLWNFYKSEHTIVQSGFLHKYKNWSESIKTVGLLKNKYPDIFFTGICSESQFSKAEHQLYYNELMQQIKDLDLQENVALIRGFQSDAVIDSYLRINKVALFPYASSVDHEVFGASGFAREAMSKGLPVVSSKVNHFSDLPTIKADNAEEMAQAIGSLFSNKKTYANQIAIQNKYLEDNTWEIIAGKHIEIFEEG